GMCVDPPPEEPPPPLQALSPSPPADSPKAANPNCLRLMLEIVVFFDTGLSCLFRLVSSSCGQAGVARTMGRSGTLAQPSEKPFPYAHCDLCHDNLSRRICSSKRGPCA